MPEDFASASKKIDQYKANQTKLTEVLKKLNITEISVELDGKIYTIWFNVRECTRFSVDMLDGDIKEACMIPSQTWFINFK